MLPPEVSEDVRSSSCVLRKATVNDQCSGGISHGVISQGLASQPAAKAHDVSRPKKPARLTVKRRSRSCPSQVAKCPRPNIGHAPRIGEDAPHDEQAIDKTASTF